MRSPLLILSITIQFLAIPLLAQNTQHFLSKPLDAPKLLQMKGVSGTFTDEFEDYCYYSFRSRKYSSKCIDQDYDDHELKKCKGDNDEIYQAIPSGDDGLYYFRNVYFKNYIKVSFEGERQTTYNLNEATKLYYKKFEYNNDYYYYLRTGNIWSGNTYNNYQYYVKSKNGNKKLRLGTQQAVVNDRKWEFFAYKQDKECVEV